jgi:hypothetical protein
LEVRGVTRAWREFLKGGECVSLDKFLIFVKTSFPPCTCYPPSNTLAVSPYPYRVEDVRTLKWLYSIIQNLTQAKVKGKGVPVHAMRANRITPPLLLDVGTH